MRIAERTACVRLEVRCEMVPDLAARLPNRRYLTHIYIDREGGLKKDADAEFTKADIVATVEFSGAWNKGWKEPNIVDVSQFKSD